MFVGCGNTKTFTEKEQKAYQGLLDIVNSKNIEIIAQRAMPMMSVVLTQVLNTDLLPPDNNSSHFNTIGNSNALIIKGDSIKAFLPFYGEQFFRNNLGNNHHGITFNDIPEDYRVSIDDKRHKVDVSFKINDSYQNNER